MDASVTAEEFDVEEVRRQVAQEYHRVMLDLAMTGSADMPIVKEGKNLVRRFSKLDDGTIIYSDVAADDADQVGLS